VRERLLPKLAAGTAIGTVALLGSAGLPGRVDVVASASTGGWTLDGAAAFVSDLTVADVVIVAAASAEDELLLFVVEPDADGVTIASTPSYDPTRTFGRLSLTGVQLPADALLVEPALGGDAYWYLLRRAAIAISADALGGAERILEITLAYMRERRQFGQPIGAFQALKHRAADVAMAIEMARGAVDYATGVRELSAMAVAAAIAKTQAGQAYAHAAAESVSLHGGIGYTLEHPAHIYLKRAKLDQLWFGSSEWHQDQLATLALRRTTSGAEPARRPATTAASRG
jgi:alkylation response protein AidB-like acyl-CoA dehydrogenase